MKKLRFQDKNNEDWLNEKRFKSLFSEYWEQLLGFCEHYIQDSERAKEMVQDIFLSLWERRESINISVNVGHYLFSVARFQVSRYFRDQTAIKRNTELALRTFNEATNSTEEAVLVKDLRYHIQGLVDRLSIRCREVYIMSRNEGLTIPEISHQLGLSEKTVEAHLTKALKHLKTEINAVGN